jgi:hypothetical protein
MQSIFKKPSRSEVEEILTHYIWMWEPDSFNEKLVLEEPGQLAFRFNVAVFNTKMEEIGLALPANSVFEKPMLLSVVETQLYLDSDFENIRTHFQCNHRNNSRCWRGFMPKIRCFTN